MLTGSFLYFCGFAEAAIETDLQSPYPGRVYSHDQWFRVFVQVGNNLEKLVDTSWRPVFDYPEKLGSGYTADRASNVENNSELANYLKAANLYDDATGMYLFSKAGAQLIGKGNNYVQFSVWNQNIPIRSTSSDSELMEIFGRTYPKTSGASKNKPHIARSNSPPSDVVWDGSKFYYALSVAPVDGERRGIINLNRNSGAHKAFVTSTAGYNVGYGEMHMYFPYDTRFTSSAPVIWGDVTAGEKVSGYIHAVNLSPWTSLAEKTQFRVYTRVKGEEPKLAASVQKLQMEPMVPKQIPFEFAVPGKQFDLILTINMYWDGGRWVNEPLATITGISDSFVVSEMEQEYYHNKIEINYIPGEPPRENEQNPYPSNLAVTNLELLNDKGEPAGGLVEVNKPYKVRATFNSSFDKGGWAKARFYIRRESGWLDYKGEKNIYFDPKGTSTATWDWSGTTENVSLIVTISYRWWEQQSKWEEEEFEGEKEATYTDNIMEQNAAGTDIPKGPPTPGSWSYPLYYHPVKEMLVPVYEEKEVTVVEPEWIEIPFYPAEDNARIITRLVPTPSEESILLRKQGD
jgi:hypothetical protein